MNIRPESTNIGGKILDIGLGNISFGFDTRAKAAKAKLNKRDWANLKSFYTAMKTINEMKKQPTKQQKIFAYHVSDMELISKMCKQVI